MITRRKTIKTLALGAVSVTTTCSLPWFVAAQNANSFTNPLKIPKLEEGSLVDDLKEVHLRLQKGLSTFFDTISTPTIGINGSYLGPTLRFKMGDNLNPHVHNTIGERTTIHWHGLHVPARADGGPTQIIEDGDTWKPEFTIQNKAGTFWYHSHMLHKTGKQVYHGLAGMMIIDDEESQALNLPSRYGVDDIPLIVQDRDFKKDGSFRYLGEYGDIIKGMRGNTILVNGTVSPLFRASSSKVRFRILNAANARTFTFAFSDGRQFQQIASDGGLLEQPVELNQLILAPAERAEIIVDFSAGKNVSLISLAKEPDFADYPGEMSRLMREVDTEGFDILAIEPESILTESANTPSKLTQIPKLQKKDVAKTRRFTLEMGDGPRSGKDRGPGTGNRDGSGGGFGGGNYSINGRYMTSNYINEQVKLDTTEIWEVTNKTLMAHPFHVHDVQFQILDRDGIPPPLNERGLKDTVRIHSEETVRLIMRFEDFADPDISYMYHCHNLEHEDRGMMGQFLVVTD